MKKKLVCGVVRRFYVEELNEGIAKAMCKKRGGRRDWLRRKQPFDSLRPAYFMNAQTL